MKSTTCMGSATKDELRSRIDRLEAQLAKVRSVLEAASEERYQCLEEWRQQAERWKKEGDMYGWNFHMGMSAGANWVDIFYRRITRALEIERAALDAEKED